VSIAQSTSARIRENPNEFQCRVTPFRNTLYYPPGFWRHDRAPRHWFKRLVRTLAHRHKQVPFGLITSVPDAVNRWPDFHALVRI
jgi:hypothetical protein